MSWRLARSLGVLRDQVNLMFPGRDKRSDGTIGDAAHQGRKSDHNPNKRGVVTAIDLDENDAGGGETVGDVVWRGLLRSRDPRIKYVIYEGKMFSSYPTSSYPAWTVRPGKGHHQHLHLSVQGDPALYDDRRPWDLGREERYGMKRGDVGHDVKFLQSMLNDDLDGADLKVDGDFGDSTHSAVVRWQEKMGMMNDGVADALVLAVLAARTR